MKNPWFAFAGICSLVLAIVMFSVVFGGYSSLIRAQKRIEAMEGHLQEQCRIQLDDARSLLADLESGGRNQADLAGALDAYADILDRLDKKTSPLPPDLISGYGAVQIRLNHSLTDVIRELKTSAGATDMEDAVKKLTDQEATVFVTGKRYNKEARYFNTRTTVFPGFIIAKLFNLDELRYHEIPLERPKSSDTQEAAGAS